MHTFMALFMIGKPAMAIKKKTIRNYRLRMYMSAYASLGLMPLTLYWFRAGEMDKASIAFMGMFFALAALYGFARNVHPVLSNLYISKPEAFHDAATATWRLKVRLGYLIHWPLRPLYNAIFLHVMGFGDYHGYIDRAQYKQRLKDYHETGRRYLERNKTFHWALDWCAKAIHAGNAILAAGMIVSVTWSDAGRSLIITAALLYVAAAGLAKFASMKRRNLQGR